MRRNVAICPLPEMTEGMEYDLVAVALGYEERSRFLAETFRFEAKSKIAWAFSENHVFSFAENRNILGRLGFQVKENSDEKPHDWISTVPRITTGDESPIRLCIDVSSFSRVRLAQWIETIANFPGDRQMQVDFCYSAANYVEPPAVAAPNTWAGPVTPTFAGWASHPDFPTVLLVGMGYEPDRAIGAVEYIEPKEVVILEPVSNEARFTPKINEANIQLLSLRPPPTKVTYRVENPYQTLVMLDGTVRALSRRARPIILPLGPKVFALSSLLAATLHPSLSVWRVSAGDAEEPIQRSSTGEVVGLRAIFSPRRF